MSSHRSGSSPPITPDGRYIVVRGRLWRASNPALGAPERAVLVDALMAARRSVGQARRAGDPGDERAVRTAVNAAKIALGERGPPWWTDGAADFNRLMARNTAYAAWHAAFAPTG